MVCSFLSVFIVCLDFPISLPVKKTSLFDSCIQDLSYHPHNPKLIVNYNLVNNASITRTVHITKVSFR